MESPAGRNSNGLNVVILADTLCTLFAKARADALDIGQNERLTRAAPDEGIQNDGLKEGQAERIGREGHALPAVRGDEVGGCEVHRNSLPDLEPPLNGGQL